ncbi:hypothetical protein [Aminobacter sp. AP02]|uniref:hypothetical protein n=1 Tax=Aminobacter sp. AP02 TaxID=2135737 RepID=UPI000D6B362D|nr:hypothetical protein [Aminobacter sp. AP02]PWK68194.1 hypothetical protein C8K44_111106 [Aminobacter sp. AP02]
MRLFAAFLAAGISMSGAAHASSIIVVEGDATSPSSILVGAPKSASSIIAIGVPSIDAGKVAAVDSSSKSKATKLGGELMVIRGGEVGSASPEPAAAAPAQQAATGDQAPMPTQSAAPVDETASAELQ